MASVRITPKDIERFTRGDCDILAHALSELTGWPVYSLHWGGEDACGLHAFALAPGKIAVDIEGARSVSKLVARWRDEGAAGYVRGCWTTAMTTHEAYEGSTRRAKKLAPHLAALGGFSTL